MDHVLKWLQGTGAKVVAVGSVVLALVVGSGLFVPSSATQTLTPVVSSLSFPATSTSVSLSVTALSCSPGSSSTCVAVGQDNNNEPAVIVGNPTTWAAAQSKELAVTATSTLTYTPSPTLTAVSCPTSTFCVAIGSLNLANGKSAPILIKGNPTTWAASGIQTLSFGSLGGSGTLNGVSCVSASLCVAVGSDGNNLPIVLDGNPSTWTSSMSPTQFIELPINLPSVSGASGASGAQGASGSSGAGGGYSAPSRGSFSMVSCASSSSCTALGTDTFGNPLSLVANPSSTLSWTQNMMTDLPANQGFMPYFGSLSCPSASYCLAVGHDSNGQPVVLSGDPTTWSTQMDASNLSELGVSSAMGSGGQLVAVSCAAATNCTAVGWDNNNQPMVWSGDFTTVTQANWDQTNIAQTEVTLDSGFGGGGQLSAVSCATTSSCSAVGFGYRGQDFRITASPSGWAAAQPAEFTVGSWTTVVHGYLLGMSCVPTSSAAVTTVTCVAVGFNGNGQPMSLTGVTSSWNGSAAKALTLGSTFGSGGQLNAVSCVSATQCVAVGVDNANHAIVIEGNPATWTAASIVHVDGVPFGALNAISCTSYTYCVAVGGDTPMSVIGNPATWGTANHLTSLNPSSPSDLGVTWNGISCVATSASSAATTTTCTAVGGNQENQPVEISGNPNSSSAWSGSKVNAIALGSFGNGGSLQSVACTAATACVAVGGDGTYGGQPLLFSGNPANWAVSNAVTFSVPDAPAATVQGFSDFVTGDGQGSLSAVRCTSATACTAVGTDGRMAPIFVKGTPSAWTSGSVIRPAVGTNFTSASFQALACSGSSCFVAGVNSSQQVFISSL